MGASFIHNYHQDNPITQLQKKFGLATSTTDLEDLYALRQDTGKAISTQDLLDGYLSYKKVSPPYETFTDQKPKIVAIVSIKGNPPV